MISLKSLLPDHSNYHVWLMAAYMLFILIWLQVNPEMLLISYFMETILIGMVYLIKMGMTWYCSNECSFKDSYGKFSEFFLIPFFALHYFFFVAIQSVFLFTFFRDLLPGITSELDLVDNYLRILKDWDVQITIGGLTVFQLMTFMKDFVLPGHYRKSIVKELMAEPYVRIFVQQLVVILTGFFFLFIHAGLVAGVLLILMRMVLDLNWIASGGRADWFKSQSKIH